MKTLLPLALLVLSSTVPAWARPSAPTHKSLTYVMQEIRDPIFGSQQRKQYLQLTQNFMQKQLTLELNSSADTLGKKFIENQAHLYKLTVSPWRDLQTEFYTTLHQEMIFQKWQAASKKGTVTDYGKRIADSMVGHLGRFSAVKEGRYYNRWSSVSRVQNGKTRYSKIPYFVFGSNVSSMLSMDAYTPYEEFLPKDSEESPGNPSLSNFLKNAGARSRDDYQELAEKTQLNHLIYNRAVANSAKTIASVYYLTGEHSLKEAENKVGNFLSSYCDGCSSREKLDFQRGAMAHTLNTKKELSHNFTPKSIVTTFCSTLQHSGYIFADKPAPTPLGKIVIFPDNTRVDRTDILNKITVNNITVINKTINEHDLGVLFLTPSLSRLSSTGKPTGTNLECTPEALEADAGLIRKAIDDARKNVELYISRINTKVKESMYSIPAATETLEYFAQTNVSATAEALMGFPQGMNHVIESIIAVDRNVKRRQRVDTAVAWGGTIIGIGLTVTGVGAPEGLAILLAVGAMTKGATWGSYYLYRSHQEKLFYRELLLAKKGTNVNFYLDSSLSKHYEEYRNMKVSYMVEFAQSAMSFGKLHAAALDKTGGNVEKAHGLIKKSLAHAKAVSSGVGEDQIMQFIVSGVL